MDIFVNNNDEKFKLVSDLDGKDFPDEKLVQSMMEENLENISLDENSNSKLLVLGREIETGNGRLDILAIDGLGSIYIVEAKLNDNQTRRKIIAQLIDYAAGLWKNFKDFEKFEQVIRKQNNNQSLVDLIGKFEDFERLADEEKQEISENVQKNLEAGIFKFITVWDQRDDKLDNTINYINQKIKNITIYVITLKYFKDHGLELYIPDVFGRESEKLSTVKSSPSKWSNEESIRKKFKEEFSEKEFSSFEKLFKFTQDKGHINYGRGNKIASISSVFAKFSKTGTMSLLTLKSNGKLYVNFEWMKPELREPFADRLNSELGISMSSVANSQYLTRDQWSPNTDKIIKTIQEFL